jgi:hypothetical protein
MIGRRRGLGTLSIAGEIDQDNGIVVHERRCN